MLTKRIVGAVAAAAAAAMLLAGCSGGGTEGPDGAAGGGDALTFWAYEPNSKAQKDALDNLIAEFEAIHQVDVKVTYVPKDGFNTKINSSIAVGRNPDVSYLDQPLMPRFVEDDTLLDLTDRVDAGVGRDAFYPGAMATNVVDGRVYGLPQSLTTVALFYNKSLVPTAPATWEEWIASAQQVHASGQIAAFEGIGGGGYGAWLFPVLVHSGGGAMVNADETAVTFGEAPGIEAAQLLVTLQEYSDQEVRQSQNAFGNGLIAYKISGSWDVEALQTNFPDLDFGVAPIPAKAGHASVSNMGGENLVIYKNSPRQDLAWEFVSFLTGAQGNQVMAYATGNFAANVEASAAAGYDQDPYLAPFAAQLESAVGRPLLADWLKVNDEVIGSALDRILVSGGDPQVVLPEAQSAANQMLFG